MQIPGLLQAVSLKYGVTEKKLSELNKLTLKVLDAQYKLDQFQAVVNALNSKLQKFNDALKDAENGRNQALENKNLVDRLVQHVLDIENNSGIALAEIVKANGTSDHLAKEISNVIQKLIYTVNMVNKLSVIVTRRKALNPLISDELISQLVQAGKDANNAISLTLVALSSVSAVQASNAESGLAMTLEYKQAASLFSLLTGEPLDYLENNALVSARATRFKDGISKNPDEKDNLFSFEFINDEVPSDVLTTDAYIMSLLGLLTQAYEDAKTAYEMARHAVIRTTTQLNNAKSSLDKAQVKLNSLQSGLKAASAAALA